MSRHELDNEVVEMAVALARSMRANGFGDLEIRARLRKRFEEVEIDAAMARLVTPPAAEGTASLHERSEFLGWYGGSRVGKDFHWPRLIEFLRNKETAWSDEMIKSLDEASTTILEQLAPPTLGRAATIKGLVLGHIQSGKTANFSAVIAKAVDEGYKLVIVLAGLHNNLRKQTEIRLREELVNPADGTTCTTLTDVDENGDFKRRQPVSANSQLGRVDGFTLVVLKKNSPVLRNFLSWLGDSKGDVARNCPTLIIDDEADQASINTSKPENDPTAINNHIRKLIQAFNVCSYVGYTATPFANVFIDSDLSDDLYPKDFLIALEKPRTYYGAEELFGSDGRSGDQSNDGLPIIRPVSVEDAIALQKKTRPNGTAMPSSLTSALNSFLVAAGIRLTRGQWKDDITMLVHISHLTDTHDAVVGLVETYLEGLRADLACETPTLRSDLEVLWESDFREVTKQILGQVDHKFDAVWKNVCKFITSLEIVKDNSRSQERLVFDRRARGGIPLWGIVVGGNTLSRGLTIEGLTTSFFVRASKAYDTLLQMGRWFGYRKGYVDVTRIYVTDELYENFYNLASVEQEIREEVRVMSLNGEAPYDVPLRIRRLPGLSITAANKMRNAVNAGLTYGGSKVQTHQLVVTNADSVSRNQKAIENCVSMCLKHGKITPVKFFDLQNCSLIRNVSPEIVLQFLDSFEVSENNAKFNRQNIKDYIVSQNSRNELNDWSVAVMSLKSGNPIKLAGLNPIPVRRNVKHETKLESGETEVTLRAISVPGEELIDLDDYVRGEFRTTDDLMTPKAGSRKSDIQLRRELRPTSRGLLLIYPLESNLQMTKDEYSASREKHLSSYPLKCIGQVFAISLVFPFDRGASSLGNYSRNRTVVGQN